jgi:ATP-dependent protease HslVU (ClpYQ) ATPase subunit
MKFNVFEKVSNDPKIQEVIKKHKEKIYEFFKDMVGSPEDMVAVEEMAFEAATGSPEMQEAFKQVLLERKQKRESEKKDSYEDLVIDEEGKLVHRENVFSGERQ